MKRLAPRREANNTALVVTRGPKSICELANKAKKRSRLLGEGLQERLGAEAAFALAQAALDGLIGLLLDRRLVAAQQILERALELIAGIARGFAFQDGAEPAQRHPA